MKDNSTGMPELKPCPFCGGDPVIDKLDPLTTIRCETCKFARVYGEGPLCTHEDGKIWGERAWDHAINVWNTRSGLVPAQEDVRDTVIRTALDRIETLAFQIPPPNAVTPQIVQMVQCIRTERSRADLPAASHSEKQKDLSLQDGDFEKQTDASVQAGDVETKILSLLKQEEQQQKVYNKHGAVSDNILDAIALLTKENT